MSSWYYNWSDGIKKRACRYLLQRYLGQFLEEKLTLDQLSVDIYNGTGSVSNVSIDVQALNELGEQKNLPIEFVDGFMAEINVSIPWATLLTDSIFIEVSGMQITIQPRQRAENGESMLESMWSSVASSMQIAAECLKQEPNLEDEKVDAEHQMEGLEIFAQTIESVLTRVKIKFVDTTLRLEHLPKEGKNGIAFEIRAKTIEYCDETSCEEEEENQGGASKSQPLFSIKKFHSGGISFYTDEFPCANRTFSRSVLEDLTPTSDKETNGSSPILIGKLSGIQEVRIKSKKLENLTSGPKFELEFSLGSLSLFISPRQLYLLIEIAHSLSAPHTQDSSNVKYKKSEDKLISSTDYRKIEQDLHDTLYSQNANPTSAKNFYGKGWASRSIEESDDEFFPFGQRGGSMSASLYSNNTDMSWETSASTALTSKGDFNHSFSSTTDPHGSYKKPDKGNIFDLDISGETIAFYLRLSSISVVILHDDILTFSLDTFFLTPSSVSTMNNISTQFFDQLGTYGVSGFGNKDFEASKSVFQKACNLDHVRIMATGVIIEGREGGSNSSRFCHTKVSSANFELLECLFEPNTQEPQYVELLKFMKSGYPTPVKPHFPFSNQPDLRINIMQTKKSRPNHVFTKTDITFSLQQCWSELDLSLYDRLSTIFTSRTLCCTENLAKGNIKQSPFYEAFENAIVTDNNFSLKVQCPFLVIKFRFPIPDMRPDIEKGRHPWWKRSIRKDILFANLVDPIFQTEINYHGTFLDYKLQCSQISFLLQIGDSDTPVPFLYSAPVDRNYDNKKTFYEYPRLSVKFCMPKPIDEIEDVKEKEDNGLTCSFMETPVKESSPFASKRFVHKGDSSPTSACEGEEVILPASKEDINKFINEVLENSKYQVDIILPYIHIDFCNKHLYEVLYNRFSADVALWQSAASKITPMSANLHSSDIDNIFPRPYLYNSFSMCKSGVQLGEDLDSGDESDSGGEGPSRLGGYTPQNLAHKYHNGQSNLALQIHINNGHLSICPNLKDSIGNIVPDKHGELYFSLEKAHFFTVTHYKGVYQKNYMCLQVEELSVHHKAVMNNYSSNNILNQTSFKKRSQLLKPIIYKSNPNTTSIRLDKVSNDKPDMFTLALSSSVDNRKIKTMRVSCGIKGATLRHYVTPSEHSWLTQVRDFFDVVDYPVKGYDSPQSITELYLNLEDSSIDYRPLNIPTKCVVYFGNFSLSSNIASRTKTSTLRFIAEETNLFISEKNSKSSDEVNLRKDYVSVIDLGLFELSLRLSDNPSCPKVDLKASSDIFNIRTCADSASALAQLITYYASNGDFNMPEKVEETKHSEPYLEKTLESNENDQSASDPSVTGQVYDMMEDAMKDLTTSEHVRPIPPEETNDVKVFYFPDEGKTDDCEQAYDWATGDFDSDSDFCFLDDEPISPILPEGKHPVVRSLSDKPIQIIENHFNVSLGKTDFLLPPKYYPAPVYRYTLSDMNLVWHMFGGRDFNSSPPSKKNLSFDVQTSKHKESEVNINTDIDDRVSYKSLMNPQVGPELGNRKPKIGNAKQRTSRNKWFTAGGAGRELDVLMQFHFSKVRFQYEIYPEKTVQASRQVLLIHNFEIRDRLTNSQINKFLYQFTSESNPRQSNANMVMVKIVHTRPDTRRNVQETCLRVSLLPLRLNIDQDSLEFLYGFFCQLSTKSSESPGSSSKKENIPPENHDPIFEANSEKSKPTSKSAPRSNTYIRNFVFSPDVPIRIDYEGKRVNMSHGPMAGIIMGIGQLSCLQIKLKRLSYKQGLLGWDRLLTYVFSEWLKDIKTTQFPCIIGGVGPMHALVQLFMGIRDLFWLPIEQYQKDGRIFRGIQRGANSFTTSTVIAALELTARIVQAIQSLAEAAFDMVSPGPSVRRIHGNKSKKPIRHSEPADIREGVSNAYTLVKEGLEETAETLVRVASSEAEQKGAVGAVGGVLRQIPPSMVAPIIIASAATNNLLGGVRNQLAPDSRREASFKWKANET